MKMKVYVFFALTLLSFLCACVSQDAKLGWTKKSVSDLVMSLDDPRKEEFYGFNGDGTVAVTWGTKGGWIASPLYTWRIQRGILEIFNNQKEVFQQLELVEMSSNTVVAVNKDHKQVRYRRVD